MGRQASVRALSAGAGARWAVPVGLAALIAISLLVRTTAMDTGFWIDEGLSVGIADRPLSEIPAALRQDGSPPLYYLLLHAWIALVGRGEVATHVLSLLFALLCVPAAWWALREGFGARAAWMGATLAAVNPFLNQYAQETRMYSLIVLLGVVACGAFVRALVFGDQRWRVPFGVTVAALLYAHNWSLFFAAACGAVWMGLLWRTSREHRGVLLRDGLLAFGVTVVLYLPWLPSTLFQAAHTGAPWALAPSPAALPDVFARLLGSTPQYLLLVAGGAGLVALAREGSAADATRAAGLRPRAVAALVGIELLTLVLAWLSSQLSPAWALRYLAVAVPPLLLLAAAGLSRAGGVGLAGLAVVCALWAVDGPPADKSNVRDVAASLSPGLRPGDLVVSTQPEQIPVLAYYLPPGLRYATLWGTVDDRGVTDWRDGVQRLRRTSAEHDLAPLIRALAPGRRLVLIEPIVYERARWSAPWTELVRVRSLEWRRYAGNDERLRIAATYPPTSYPPRPNPVRATVWIRMPSD